NGPLDPLLVNSWTAARSHSFLTETPLLKRLNAFGLPNDESLQRVCGSDGKWSGKTPKCKEIRCLLPPRPNNTVISVSSTERLHGTSVIRSKQTITLKYRCERGFILKKEDGSAGGRVMTRRCNSDTSWTGTNPKCEFVDCGTPDVSEMESLS
ncbi:Uncharacterized protein FKW44_020891, partial [Caligus rogercresseyi]